MKAKVLMTVGALLIALLAFVCGLVCNVGMLWSGGYYFVQANRHMIQITLAASEDRDPRQCLALFQEYFEKATKHPWAIGYVHANLVKFERSIWALEEAAPAKEKSSKEPVREK